MARVAQADPRLAELARRIEAYKPPERLEPRLIYSVEEKLGLARVAAPFKSLRIQPQGAARVVLHVFSRKLEGQYRGRILNTGLTPVLGLSFTSNADGNAGGEWVGLYRGKQASVGRLRRGQAYDYTFKWIIADEPIDILWALVNIMLNGYVHVRESVKASAIRYRANLRAEAQIPVEDISVSWD